MNIFILYKVSSSNNIIKHLKIAIPIMVDYLIKSSCGNITFEFMKGLKRNKKKLWTKYSDWKYKYNP